MKEKVQVKICLGTLCYVMGGANLPLLAEKLPPEMRGKVKVVGAPCLEYCNELGNEKAPFVEINGKCVANASLNKVMALIEEELKDGTY